MIKFGKTNEEKRELKIKEFYKNQEKIERLMNGVKKFAWFPVKIDTGEYVWLTKYYQYYSAYRSLTGNIVLCTEDDKPIIRNYLDEDSKYIGFFTQY